MRKEVKLTALELCERLINRDKVFTSRDYREHYFMNSDNEFIYFEYGCEYKASITSGTYYIETPWYENIPERGVLCRVQSGEIFIITNASQIDGNIVFFCTLGFRHHTAKPLTDSEIEAFKRGEG